MECIDRLDLPRSCTGRAACCRTRPKTIGAPLSGQALARVAKVIHRQDTQVEPGPFDDARLPRAVSTFQGDGSLWYTGQMANVLDPAWSCLPSLIKRACLRKGKHISTKPRATVMHNRHAAVSRSGATSRIHPVGAHAGPGHPDRRPSNLQ